SFSEIRVLGFGLGGGGYGSGVLFRGGMGVFFGREVVVEKRRFKEREGKKKGFNFKVPINPLSPSRDVVKLGSEAALRRPQKHALEGEKLPKCSASSSTFAQIDGEDARQFVTGLADSIGLQNVRTANIVSTAVATWTHSCFLQAWDVFAKIKLHKSITSKFRRVEAENDVLNIRRWWGEVTFTMVGEHLEEDVIEKIITNGEEGGEDFYCRGLYKNMEEGRCLRSVVEIKGGHDLAKEIERSLFELHRCAFLDMAVMVEAQGEQMDDIEHHVFHASALCEGWDQESKAAKDHRRSSGEVDVHWSDFAPHPYPCRHHSAYY
ncbi:hypothetical protein IFM89_008996, partial [Coptis chinensis]